MSKLKVLYQINSLETVYAARFIYEGYKSAFIDKGHEFRPFTSRDDFEKTLDEYNPDLFITSLNRYNLKFIDLDILSKKRDWGLVMFTQIRPWKKQSEQFGGSDLENDEYLVGLIKEGLAGDLFFHWIEFDDPCMEGFSETTGYPFHTILLAADTKLYYPEVDEKYKADVSYVGSYLKEKRTHLDEYVLPLREKHDLKVYGSDWTFINRSLGLVQKFGQYHNIGFLKKVRKISLPLEDERKVYSSSLVSINLHEDHQRKYGSDFNERTFKIIASGGFQIVDNVKALRNYFSKDELVIAKDKKDWFDKIDYYIKNPEKRVPIIQKGMIKVFKEHTYYKRVDQIIDIYKDYKK